MIKTTMNEFLHELNNNRRMQAELQALANETAGDITADDIVNFAEANGYRIAVREFDEALDDESLDRVAGGVSLLLPAVQQAREAAFRVISRSFNFKL